MVFTKRLREGVRRGRIRCSVRIWKRLHVKVGGRYPMDEGHIVVDSIAAIRESDITDELARESGFTFHYLAPGAWDVQPKKSTVGENRRTLLQRIRTSTSSALRRDRRKGL
jgi:hypothetical protein